MDGSYSTLGTDEEHMQVFLSKTPKGRICHLKSLGVDDMIILKWIFKELRWEYVYSINLARNIEKWRHLLMRLSISVSIKGGTFPD
jgi:hypothetical protein